MATTSSNPTNISGIGAFIASIPAMLEYYPHEAVLFCPLTAVNPPDPSKSRFTLEAVVCVELFKIRELGLEDFSKHFAKRFAKDEQSAVVAVIVSEQPLYEIADLAHELGEMFSHDFSQWTVVHTRSISSGEQWGMHTASFADPFEFGILDAGTIPSIAASPTTAMLLDATGELPEVSRDELYERLISQNVLFDGDELEEIIDAVREFECQEVTSEVVALAVQAGKACSTDKAALTAALQCMKGKGTRDLVMHQLCKQGRDGLHRAEAILCMANTLVREDPSFSGIRVEALSVLAIVALLLGRTCFSHITLREALKDNPHHTLSNIVLQGFDGNIVDEMAHAIHEGCEEAWSAATS